MEGAIKFIVVFITAGASLRFGWDIAGVIDKFLSDTFARKEDDDEDVQVQVETRVSGFTNE